MGEVQESGVGTFPRHIEIVVDGGMFLSTFPFVEILNPNPKHLKLFHVLLIDIFTVVHGRTFSLFSQL